VIFGSGVLVQALLRRGPIDDFVLQIHPLVLGKGRRLFPDASPRGSSWAESVTSRTGVVIVTYRPPSQS
jgi:dihydrofolate reductase